MNTLELRDGARLAWRLDDFTDPWAPAETVLFIHGNSESGLAWNRWVGPFARRWRLLRPDLRGFGASEAMPESYRWSLGGIAADLVELLDRLELGRVHVVGAKLGGLVALQLAASWPARVATLAVLGAPICGADLARGGSPDAEIRAGGVLAWARRTMAARLGPEMPPEAHEAWADYMGRTATSTQLGFVRDLPGFDMRGQLGAIGCPTLVVASQQESLVGTPEGARAWQRQIPDSRLEIVPGAGYHLALTQADRLAPRVAAFMAGSGPAATR